MKKLKKLGIMFVAMAMFISMLALPASASSDIAYGAATVTASALNIRTGPGTNYSRAGLIYRNSRVVILEMTTDDWYKINYQGTEGYVSAEYLKDVLKAENFNATGTLTATNVRIRSGPSTGYSILGMVTKSDTVQVIGINNGWYKVVTGGITGYIRSDLMRVSGAPSSSGGSSGGSSSNNSNASVGQQIADLAESFVGYPYVYGEESPSRGFDCSGLVYYCYGEFGYSLSRTAGKQYSNHGTSVSKSELQPGDLVFFSSDGGYSVTHVGIYIGDGNFVHASTSTTGVIISSLSSSYYTRVWYGAKRIV